MSIPNIDTPIPWLTTEQMVEVDRAMIEDLHIELAQMMENAGRNLAHLARKRFLGGDPRGKTVVVMAGPGGNGGGALVCARRLHAWGAQVEVFITRREGDFAPTPAHQLDILHRMRVPVAPAEAIDQAPAAVLVIDGVIGYSLGGAPRGGAGDLIRWANAQGAPVLALDTPSGIDTSTGTVYDPAIRATAGHRRAAVALRWHWARLRGWTRVCDRRHRAAGLSIGVTQPNITTHDSTSHRELRSFHQSF